MVKKIALLFVASAFVAGSLAGCGEGEKKAPDAPKKEEPKKEEGKK